MKKYLSNLGAKGVYEATQLFYTFQSPSTPTGIKILIGGGFVYLFSPIDLIPDVIPVVGWADDIFMIAKAYLLSANHVDDEIRVRAMEFVEKIFGKKAVEELGGISEVKKVSKEDNIQRINTTILEKDLFPKVNDEIRGQAIGYAEKIFGQKAIEKLGVVSEITESFKKKESQGTKVEILEKEVLATSDLDESQISTDKIIKYKELCDSGIITEEEFKEVKKKLLQI